MFKALRLKLRSRLLQWTTENPRERLIQLLELRGEIHPRWAAMLDSPDVISNDVHVPDFDKNTSDDEYRLLLSLEDAVATISHRFWHLGSAAKGSTYKDFADFLNEAHRMLKGARQQYEQIRFSGGELRMSTRREDMEDAAERAVVDVDVADDDDDDDDEQN